MNYPWKKPDTQKSDGQAISLVYIFILIWFIFLVFKVMEYVSGTKPTIVAFNMPCVQIPIHIHWTM